VNVRRSLMRLTTVTMVAVMPLLGLSAVASAKTKKLSTPNCVKHPNKAKCANAGGGTTGTGGGATTDPIIVEVDPQPLVETGQSEVHAVVQVETSPSFAGDEVNIDSSQLAASCASADFETMQIGGPQVAPPIVAIHINRISVVLDDDGNATVVLDGFDCAPGSDVIEADLEVAPFLTALTTLVVNPPVVTPEGLSVYPRFNGLNAEVETGDTTASGDSDIYAVFYVETNPVYAEQQVEIGSAQLEGRCIEGWLWQGENQTNIKNVLSSVSGVGVNTGPEVQTQLDDDGNAVFVFEGASCASGPSQVIADVLAGTHPTYTVEFSVLPPQPTI
jgi:hypothetical protein